MKTYIAYGSNMNLEQMKKRCPKSEKLGLANLEGYKLNFRGRGHANIIENKDSNLPVVLWKITEDCEENLDVYEDYPDYYIKKDIELKFEGKNIEAMVYIMNEKMENILVEPSEEYFKIILEGYKLNNIRTDGLLKALEENKRENKK